MGAERAAGRYFLAPITARQHSPANSEPSSSRNAEVTAMIRSSGKVLGELQNIKLRLDASFVQMAAEGKL